MSGVEVVAVLSLVTGIVSAFAGSAALFKGKRKFTKAMWIRLTTIGNGKLAQQFKLSLTAGQNEVGGQYNQGFAALGQKFSIGDDISQQALTAILIKMQQEMIGALTALLQPGSNSKPNLAALLRISNSSRLNTISTLTDQYQRFATAARILPSLDYHYSLTETYPPETDDAYSVPRHTYAPKYALPKKSFSRWASSHPDICPGSVFALDDKFSKLENPAMGGTWKCGTCNYQLKYPVYEPEKDKIVVGHRFHYASHTKGGSTFICLICWGEYGVSLAYPTCSDLSAHGKLRHFNGATSYCANLGGFVRQENECNNEDCTALHF